MKLNFSSVLTPTSKFGTILSNKAKIRLKSIDKTEWDPNKIFALFEQNPSRTLTEPKWNPNRIQTEPKWILNETRTESEQYLKGSRTEL